MLYYFFVFKQKTAYELRISDWSSDVCSSDLDEIDKADIEFPNDLLQELDRMEFHVYETGETVKAKERPIVVITPNNEKELPDAFLPRCFFHYNKFRSEERRVGEERVSTGISRWSPSN